MKDISTIIIKALSPELKADYLDFFDNRAFTDGNPNGPCYCTSPNQSKEAIQQMVSEFKVHGVKETVRRYAVKLLIWYNNCKGFDNIKQFIPAILYRASGLSGRSPV